MLLSVALEQDVERGAKVTGLAKRHGDVVAVVEFEGKTWHYWDQNHVLNYGEIAIELDNR